MKRYRHGIVWELKVKWMHFCMRAARFFYWRDRVWLANWFLQQHYSLMEVDGELIRIGHERL